MPRIIMLILLGITAGIAQVSFFSVLPFPFPAFDAAAVGAAFLLFHFKAREALIFGMPSAAVFDVLSADSFGPRLPLTVILIILLSALCKKVFTNHTVYAYLGLQAAAFLLSGLLTGATAHISSFFDGAPVYGAGYHRAFALLPLALQLAAAAIAFYANRSMDRVFSSRFLSR